MTAHICGDPNSPCDYDCMVNAALPTCGKCLFHSPKDSCCSMTGGTKKQSDAACSEFSNGKTEERKCELAPD